MQESSARNQDVNGWVVVKGNPLSKVGVFPYRGRQIPGAPDPNAIYLVYRSAEELGSPETLESFKLVPWIDDHAMLGSEENGLTPPEKKGVQGVIGEEVYFQDGILYGNIKVFSEAMADLIAAGKKELSCGYRCRYEAVSGSWNGQSYDYVQRHIRGNHLALVGSGRMGADVAVLDSQDSLVFTLDSAMINQEKEMAEETQAKDEGSKDSGMSLEQVVSAINSLLPAIAALQAAATGGAPVASEEDEDVSGGDPDENNPPVADAEAAKEAEKPGSDESKKGDKPAEGMDAAILYKDFMSRIAAKNRIADKLSTHIGTFDHAEMSELQVAAYGCKKLGIKADSGTEVSVLSGWLQGRPDPRKQPIAKAMDAAVGGNNFVSQYVKGA